MNPVGIDFPNSLYTPRTIFLVRKKKTLIEMITSNSLTKLKTLTRTGVICSIQCFDCKTDSQRSEVRFLEGTGIFLFTAVPRTSGSSHLPVK
jgi:hypothetical protein